jgi:integrase
MGNTLIDAVTGKDVLDALREVEARGAVESARKTLGMIGQIMRYAIASQLRETDPTAGLHGALQKRVQTHFAAAVTREDAAAVVRAVKNCSSAYVVRLALQFLMLTFVRPGNVRHARWADIDIKKKVWSIPAEQMKMARPHEVPLSKQALAVLHEASRICGDSELVFPSLRNRGKPLSEAVFVVALRSAGIAKEQMTGHGFRSMASTLLNEAGEQPDLIEKQLAHVSADRIRGIYNRAEYWKQRVAMMQRWADMLDELEKG